MKLHYASTADTLTLWWEQPESAPAGQEYSLRLNGRQHIHRADLLRKGRRVGRLREGLLLHLLDGLSAGRDFAVWAAGSKEITSTLRAPHRNPPFIRQREA